MDKKIQTRRLLSFPTQFERTSRKAGQLWTSANERGQGTTEFGTIIAILVLIVVAAMALFREALLGLFQSLAGRMGGF